MNSWNSTHRSQYIRMFNATFNIFSAIPWRLVLMMQETGENHRPAASHLQTLSHNVVSSTPRHKWDSNSSQLLWW